MRVHWLVLKQQRKEDRSNVFEEMVAGDFPKVTERHQTPGSRRLQTLSNTDTKKITARHEARHKVRPLNIQDREEVLKAPRGKQHIDCGGTVIRLMMAFQRK